MQSNSASNAIDPQLFAEREQQKARPGTPQGGTAGTADRRDRVASSARQPVRSDRARLELSKSKEFSLQDLALLSIAPIFRSIHRWWLHRAERHYLICADVELQRAREAQMNVAYYQKRAALARSARH